MNFLWKVPKLHNQKNFDSFGRVESVTQISEEGKTDKKSTIRVNKVHKNTPLAYMIWCPMYILLDNQEVLKAFCHKGTKRKACVLLSMP